MACHPRRRYRNGGDSGSAGVRHAARVVNLPGSPVVQAWCDPRMGSGDETVRAVDRAAETARLVRAARAGDREAFGRLVELHQRSVTRLAYRILGDRDDADGAAQDAFVKAWRSFGRFRAECPFEAWLSRIVVNQCRDRLKRARRRVVEMPFELETAIPRGTGAHQLDQPMDSGPEARTAGREIGRKIAEQIGALPEMQREVFALRYYEDRSLAEIAALSRVSIGTVKTHLFRATRRIRKAVEALYGTRFPWS